MKQIKLEYTINYIFDEDNLKQWYKKVLPNTLENIPKSDEEWIDYLFEADNFELLDYLCDKKEIY